MSVTAARLPLYIKGLKAGRIFTLAPIFRDDAWARLGERRVRKLRVKFAKPGNLAAMEDKMDTALSSARKLAAAYDATTVDLTVSVGSNRKKFLSRQTVIDTVNSVLNTGEEVTHLDVVVADDNGTDPIDFIEESLRAQSTIDFHGCDIEQAFAKRMDFLKSGFDDNIDYVNKLFVGG